MALILDVALIDVGPLVTEYADPERVRHAGNGSRRLAVTRS